MAVIIRSFARSLARTKGNLENEQNTSDNETQRVIHFFLKKNFVTTWSAITPRKLSTMFDYYLLKSTSSASSGINDCEFKKNLNHKSC
uniref:Uncharacterized protein n=1 Tax=Rhizophagus irregularis (strain DAOM 181602 / DAOM 197198 / MUCL 43194) TaxID=747089 RepID=U9T1I9_RHIID